MNNIMEAMNVAVENGQLGILKLPSTHSENGHTGVISVALPKAAALDHTDITAYLASLQPFDRCETSLRSPILHSAIENRSWTGVEAILRSDNGNVNVQDNIQESVLSGAALTDDVLIIKLLLQHKDIDINLSNFFNKTPLHLVVESGHIEAATLLLGHPSIDVNRKDADETALHKAIKNGNPKILQALLRHPNIDVNAKCSEGYTSLQRLMRRNHWNLLEDPLCDKLARFLFLHSTKRSCFHRPQWKIWTVAYFRASSGP